jgi:hypothetical protein
MVPRMWDKLGSLVVDTGGTRICEALDLLRDLYAHVDERAAALTARGPWPCGPGCADCCHHSVFMTTLEALYLLRHVRLHLDAPTRESVVALGTALFQRDRARILSWGEPACPGLPGTLDGGEAVPGCREAGEEAFQLRQPCPLLDGSGRCRAYPARELRGRLYGVGSLRSTGRYYGCAPAQRALAGREVRLVDAEAVLHLLRHLPLTNQEQVLPYYLWRYAAFVVHP